LWQRSLSYLTSKGMACSWTHARIEVGPLRLPFCSSWFTLFCGETNETYERYKFNKRDQEQSETIDTYVASIRTLSKTCNYGEIEESLIRDRIVIGIKDNTTRIVANLFSDILYILVANLFSDILYILVAKRLAKRMYNMSEKILATRMYNMSEKRLATRMYNMSEKRLKNQHFSVNRFLSSGFVSVPLSITRVWELFSISTCSFSHTHCLNRYSGTNQTKNCVQHMAKLVQSVE
jgi:hypothetical protein